jgi:hypothetical protein
MLNATISLLCFILFAIYTLSVFTLFYLQVKLFCPAYLGFLFHGGPEDAWLSLILLLG